MAQEDVNQKTDATSTVASDEVPSLVGYIESKYNDSKSRDELV